MVGVVGDMFTCGWSWSWEKPSNDYYLKRKQKQKKNKHDGGIANRFTAEIVVKTKTISF